jgi:DNA-binding SARP family transcriptional activator/Tfp pilus assembly protein PilF
VLWGEDPPPTAGTQIRNTIAALRRHLAVAGSGDAPVVRSAAGFMIRVQDGELDADSFDRDVRHARTMAEQGQLAQAAEALRSALSRWRGPALAGLECPALDGFATALNEQRLAAVERLIEVDLALGRHNEKIGELATLVREHPSRERLAELHMLALYRAGRRQDALDAFTDARERLADLTGLDPRPQLVALQQAILHADPELDLLPTTESHGAGGEPSIGHPRPAQLPAEGPAFTGRQAHLRWLNSLIAERAPASSSTMVVCLLTGTAGVGKTALAVHWAHHVRHQFPDGQLYVNLRGFSPGMPAMRPSEALRGFLAGLGVEPRRIPSDLDAQASLYRSLLAERRVLVLLDNAHDAEQVRPLLPGTTGCVVVVTSRNQLSGLVAAEGAQPYTVDLLEPDDALELFTRRTGAARIAAETAAAADIVERCARLPLALVVVAARAATQPALSLDALAAQVRDSAGRLDVLGGGDPVTNVRAVLSWSYQALNPETARMFGLFGLHPGDDITAPALASMAAISVAKARVVLGELAEAHLMTEHRPGRYTAHDLLRAYAAEVGQAAEGEAGRRSAVRRLLAHYVHSAHAATTALNPYRDPITLEPAEPGVVPETFTDAEAAMAWFDAEREVLVSAVERSVAYGCDDLTWRLAWTLETYLSRRGLWHLWVSTQSEALAAALRLGDLRVQARAHRGLGDAKIQLGRHEDALVHLKDALSTFDELGDDLGKAHTHHNLARVYDRAGDHPNILRHSEAALELYRATGHTLGQARSLNGIGWYHVMCGDYPRALTFCEQALDLFRTLQESQGTADAWDTLGLVHRHLGDFANARSCYQNAIELFRESGDRFNEAITLDRLGDAYEAAGDIAEAQRSWRSALSTLDELGHADAGPIRTKLGRFAS